MANESLLSFAYNCIACWMYEWMEKWENYCKIFIFVLKPVETPFECSSLRECIVLDQSRPQRVGTVLLLDMGLMFMLLYV